MKNFPLGILTLNAAGQRRTALLYNFILGDQVWRYTSNKEAVIVGEDTYAPAVIQYDSIYNSGAPDDRPTTIKSGHIEPFITFTGHDIPSALAVEIRRTWLDDTTGFTTLLFGGTVDNVTDSDDGLELECRGLLSKLDQDFPALIVSPTCTLETYSDQCGLNRDDFAVHGVIANINRNAVYVAAIDATLPDGYYAHGYAESDGVRIGIESSSGHVIQMTVPPTSWQAGQAIIVYAGDDHTLATCKGKFHNEPHFLGLGIGMPDRNPVTKPLG